MATDLSLKSPTMKIVAWVSVLLCWCGWVIALSGLSALQHDCGRAQLYKVRRHPGTPGDLHMHACMKLCKTQNLPPQAHTRLCALTSISCS
jgi:hypothetical protein